MAQLVTVVGIGMGPGDITPAAREAVAAAQVLAGGQRQIDCFPEHPGPRLPLTGRLVDWLEELARVAEDSSVAVAASGDPGFYGVAGRILARLGRGRVRVVPGVSTVAAACARLGLSWQDGAVVSLHGRRGDRIWPALVQHDLVAVYTDREHTPAWLAGEMLRRGATDWRLAVAEDLGAPEERVAWYDLASAAGGDFSELNLVVLERTGPAPERGLGLPDQAFAHTAGLITKAEVRAVALARLGLEPGHLLWDLGAGCGSVGLEASRLLWRGGVVAVERDPERVGLIEANRVRLGACNLEVIQGELPGALASLPDPDRVFIGGGGADLAEIISASLARLPAGGRAVVSAVRLEAVAAARSALAAAGAEVDLIQVAVGRGAPLAGDVYLQALNPVWLIIGVKP